MASVVKASDLSLTLNPAVTAAAPMVYGNIGLTFAGNANQYQFIQSFVPSWTDPSIYPPPAEDPGDPLVWLRRRVKEITDSVTLN